MKTSIFFASAMFLSSLSFAQQAAVRSNNSTKAGLDNSPSKVAARAGAESATAARVDANPQPTVEAASATTGQTGAEIRNESSSTVTAAKSDAKLVARQSTTAASTLSADATEIREQATPVRVEVKNAPVAHVSGSHNNKISATTSINADNHTAVMATVNQPVETQKPVVTKPVTKKRTRVRTNGTAVLNNNISTGAVQMSGLTRTGLNVGL